MENIMSSFFVLKKVRAKLENIGRDFLWGDHSEKRKIHVVN